MSAHGLLGVPDAGAFLARLTRLDPAAPVRLRSAGGRTALWAHLPWDVLVTREVAGPGPGDATVSAAALLAVLAASGQDLPVRRDTLWHWALPPAASRSIESVSGAELSRLAAAAAGTLREISSTGVDGRVVGQRAVRDALLDHVALVVTPEGGEPVEVSQRLVQAVARMGFLGPRDAEPAAARVRTVGGWVGISAPYGVAWRQSAHKLTVMTMISHPKG
ncbi:hypothetical protein [Actinoplanes palleronii]|uniref:Uncharacterized protein n=1 Tax=Actinoplanes palleronii TaxID=113570 RepID=A0ABQ4BS22_9ACTN|nr:hypothetical protein [Actinoplanes palleronii]GIE73483.1 hypothetical protein Apa02nite_095910 [Actinoplanes palleronii]